jgi:hypothetical protein
LNVTKGNRVHRYSAIALITAVCLLAGGSLNAQEISFSHLTIDNSLSQNAVYSVLQASRGFMWFGISEQFVREQCVRGMSAKSYNPDEERGAGNRPGLSFINEIIKAHRANSL